MIDQPNPFVCFNAVHEEVFGLLVCNENAVVTLGKWTMKSDNWYQENPF